MTDYKNISKRFKKWRLSKNMTQKAIANLLNVTPTYICEVETIGKGFSQGSLKILLTELDLDINWLLTGKRKQIMTNQAIGKRFRK